MAKRAHLITGGFPAGSTAGHDMDYARLRLLGFLAEHEDTVSTVANDYRDLETWLDGTAFLLTYVAGPTPDPAQHEILRRWLESGGRWFGLHGTSGGRATRIEGTYQRRMVQEAHHDTLGSFFLNHPPARRFEVVVADQHPLTDGLPERFQTEDELYLIEMLGDHTVLLTTDLAEDPSPDGFGFQYDEDTSLQADGRTRVLGYVKDIGAGSVAYVGLGHCHSPDSNIQPFVDSSVAADGETPKTFRGSWEHTAFERLVRNAISWGLEAA